MKNSGFPSARNKNQASPVTLAAVFSRTTAIFVALNN
jgi:hypothetical protein